MDYKLVKLALNYCYPLYNSSCSKEVRSPAMYVVMYISAVAVVMLTVCGNLMVLLSISHFKQLHTPTNLLLLSLTVADFLVGVMVMPFSLIELIETCWYFGETFCILYNIFVFVLTSVSISNLVFVAIDRYFAVCDPLLYSTKITIKITCLFILLSWLVSLLYNIALIYFNGNMSKSAKLSACLGDCLLSISEHWGTADLLITFVSPCSIMLTLYLKIFIVARKHAQAISCAADQIYSTTGVQRTIPKKSERKAAKTLGIVVGFFLLCWVPYYICTLVEANMNLSSSSVLMNFLSWLVYFNSFVNPVIYSLLYPWFQKSMKLIVTFEICSPASSLMNLFPEN
uniref:G-protein coupled receptors family 1 profile domain-containing protein n=1 Tax=Lepisosteus oculatus TaxID=7918 RepID=W5NK91_LEPOC